MYLLIIYLPLMSFIVCLSSGRLIGYTGSKIISNLCLFFCFLLSTQFISSSTYNNNINLGFFSWFDTGILSSNLGIHFDHLTNCMIMLITMVSLLVHLFSTSYMDGDPHLPRFMGYLSLFTFFMLVLVSSDNIVQMFIGWEGVGITSYLLINFWTTRIQANKAAIKAMVVNKVGDVGLLLGISGLWVLSGLFRFQDIINLSTFINLENIFNWINVLLIIGVMAKSAQIGLHTWLPDAMEGPTPVSALIHAATMVTAGVFLIIRMSPILESTPLILLLIIFLGSLTAFMSGTIGLLQSDLKKVIAYSTCSQLGYMVMICGFSHYYCGLFHLFNHGFFKALLFLSAGSVIHAVTDEQDMRKIGGVKLKTPLTYICIVIGSLSLCGLPFLTGFYSKDLLLELIYGESYLRFSLWLGLLTAFLTSFYSFRLIYYSFFSNPSSPIKNYLKVHEGQWNLYLPLLILLFLSIVVGYFLEGVVLINLSPPVLTSLSKSYPLILTLIGSIFSIVFIYYIKYTWKFSFITIILMVYSFFSKAWYWDFLKSQYIVNGSLKIGFIAIYKLIDNQLIEEFGPSGGSKFVSDKSTKIGYYYLGKLSSYTLAIISFVYLLSTYILLILENKKHLNYLYMLMIVNKWVKTNNN